MGAANPISEPQTMALESVHPGELDYWQSNLREALDHSSRRALSWLDAASTDSGPPALQVWGPPAPSLVEATQRVDAETTILLIRFPAPLELTDATFSRLRSMAPDRIFLLQRFATAFDRLNQTESQPAPQDTTQVLRLFHLNSDYRLSRRSPIRRRNVQLELAELVLV